MPVDGQSFRLKRFSYAAMKRHFAYSLLLLCLVGTAGGAWAQGYWRELPPDERREMRQQMREHWQQEREFRRGENAPRWRDVSQEERRMIRDQMRDQPGWAERREGRGGGRGWRRD